MNIYDIYNVYSENSVTPEALKAYYSFSGISGDFVFNNIYPKESQVLTSGTKKLLNSNLYPAFFSNRAYNYSSTTGSGVFLNSDSLRIAGDIHESFSLLIDFDCFCNRSFITGKENAIVYLENTGDLNKKITFIVGLTNASNIFGIFSGSYSGKTEIRSCELKNKINNKNMLSIYFSPSYFSIANHSILNAFDQNNRLSGSGIFDGASIYYDNKYDSITGSFSALYIGGFTKKYINPIYTGFSGYISNILYSSGLISDKVSNDLAYSHFLTGKIYNNQPVPELVVYNYSGLYLNPTGILSSGITGYNYLPSGENIGYSILNEYFILYPSGVLGNVTGYKVEYKSQTSSEIRYNDVVSIQNVYNKDLINLYQNKCYNVVDSIPNQNEIIYNNDEQRYGVN